MHDKWFTGHRAVFDNDSGGGGGSSSDPTGHKALAESMKGTGNTNLSGGPSDRGGNGYANNNGQGGESYDRDDPRQGRGHNSDPSDHSGYRGKNHIGIGFSPGERAFFARGNDYADRDVLDRFGSFFGRSELKPTFDPENLSEDAETDWDILGSPAAKIGVGLINPIAGAVYNSGLALRDGNYGTAALNAVAGLAGATAPLSAVTQTLGAVNSINGISDAVGGPTVDQASPKFGGIKLKPADPDATYPGSTPGSSDRDSTVASRGLLSGIPASGTVTASGGSETPSNSSNVGLVSNAAGENLPTPGERFRGDRYLGGRWVRNPDSGQLEWVANA